MIDIINDNFNDLAKDYYELQEEYEKLEQENKQLKEDKKKAIEYIKKNSYGWKIKYFQDDAQANELLEILGDKENE